MYYVVLIPLLPAIAFAAMAPLSRAMRNRLRWLGVVGVAGSLLLSLVAFGAVWPGGVDADAAYRGSWPIAEVGGAELTLGLLLDPVSAVMLVVVTVVGVCVQVYSLAYMRDDERVGWYFAVLSLFTAAMLALVLADNFLALYMAWEVMGVCSYLLIGFWHEQEAPRKASQKAFLVTRVGDVGFVLGLAVMYATAGSFEYEAVLGSVDSWAPGAATAVALLLLFGAMGKSAQVPLHVWLPDAMAGPTPASALIHAATMVAAGVYLVARALPIFEASGVALAVTMAVGAITALLGALLATVQYDIKRVLAYSTVSQLGYMFVAIGAGGAVAGMFHLATHAFFKSLLFLGAGVVIHAVHTQDMREMGGLARHLPLASAAFGAGALALVGIFPFSGFWSKDEILHAVWHGGHYATFVVVLATAFVTALYVARLWFRVFGGFARTERLEEAPATMIVPLWPLAAITVLLGFAAPAFSEFLGHPGKWPDLGLALTSTGIAVAGLATGWWVYGRQARTIDTAPLRGRAGRAYAILAHGYYFDAAYEHLIVRPYVRFAEVLDRFDRTFVDGAVDGVATLWRIAADAARVFDGRVVDGLVNGTASAARTSGGMLRRIQTGRVQVYQRYVLGALVLLMLWIVTRGA